MFQACACGEHSSFRVSKCFEHALVVDIRASFFSISVSVCACDSNRLSSFKRVLSYACGEYTSFAHLGVHWLVSVSRRMTGIVIDTHPACSRRSTFPPCTWQSGQFLMDPCDVVSHTGPSHEASRIRYFLRENVRYRDKSTTATGITYVLEIEFDYLPGAERFRAAISDASSSPRRVASASLGATHCSTSVKAFNEDPASNATIHSARLETS